MNCGNCNTPLESGNPICPKCGAFNDMSSIQVPSLDENIAEEVETPVEQVPADMAPPTLEVNNENLTLNVKDISDDATATVDPNYNETQEPKADVVEDLDGDGNPEYHSNDSVNIDIPSVSKPVDVVDMPTDGSAPSIDNLAPTIGIAEDESVKQFKIGGKTIKIKMGKKRNVPTAILIGGVFIFFIIGIIVGSTIFKQNICYTGVNKNNINTTDLHYVADGNNNVTQASNYKFKIPKGYTYDKTEGGINVFDSKGTWRIFIKAVPGSYENIANAKVSIEESLKTDRISVISIKESKINDINHFIIETSKNLVNRLVVFVNAENDNVFYIEITNTDNTFNYDIINIVDDIVRNAEYNPKEASIEKVPINDVTDIVVNAAEANKSLNTKAVDNE